MRYLLDYGTEYAGLAPVFQVFARTDTQADLAPHPTIVEHARGNGLYYFDYDWATAPTDSVDFKTTLGVVELSQTIYADAEAGEYVSSSSIVNMALDHLGISNKIATMYDENERAAAAKRWYSTTRKELIRHIIWDFCEKRAVLVRDTTVANQHDHWEYAYTLPTDFFVPTEIIVEGYRRVPQDWKIPFAVKQIAAGTSRRLYTDYPPTTDVAPVLSYGVDNVNVGTYPDHFITAFSWALAVKMARPLRVKLEVVRKDVWPGYQEALSIAIASEKGARGQPDGMPDASWILARY